MKAFRIIRKVFISILVIVVLLTGAIACLSWIFKDNIIQLAVNEINKHIAVRIEVNPDIELSIIESFPEVSIRFKDVKIYESYTQSKNYMATAKEVFFAFDAWDFINQKYVIKHLSMQSGAVNLKVDKNGNINYNILKPTLKNESKSAISFHLKKINISNVTLSYENEENRQAYTGQAQSLEATLSLENSTWKVNVAGALDVSAITIAETEYLKDKKIQLQLNQEYLADEKILHILPSLLKIENSDFKVEGTVNHHSHNVIDISISAEKTNIHTLLSLMPKTIYDKLSVYQSEGQVYFNGKVKGDISKNNPSISINFGFANASFYHPQLKQKIEGASLHGTFTNGVSHKSASCTIDLKEVKGTLQGRSFSGNFFLQNFDDPFCRLNVEASASVASILDFYPIAQVDSASGNVNLKINFMGHLNDLKTEEGNLRIKADGLLTFEDINFYLKNMNYAFHNLKGAFTFDRNNLEFKELSGSVANCDFNASGTIKNFISKLVFNKQTLAVDAKLSCSDLDFKKLITGSSSNATQAKNEDKQKTPGFLLPKGYQIRVDCAIDNFRYERFHGSDLKCLLIADEPLLAVKDATLKTAGGKLVFSAVANFSDKGADINSEIKATNLYIDSIFYAFENFNQNFIQDKNLKGQLNTEVQLMLFVNTAMEVVPSSITATIDASIINGELNNLEPMRKLSTFIEERQLQQIRFSEIKNKIYIANKVVSIPEMEIKSNITTINIAGTHTFDQTMDYALTVHLKDFKKKHKDKDEAFGAIEEDNKGQSLIFLKIKGSAGDYHITYDTRKTKNKIKEDLKKEKKELESIFKKREKQEEKSPELGEDFFDM